MAKKITPQQIETARTAFRNGKSIPECCSIASISRASFNKYLGNEIEMWTQERLAKTEIIPSVQVRSADEDFIQLLELEFNQCKTFEEARELYWKHKPEAITNLTRVEAFRAIYEQSLNRITGRPIPHKSTQPNTNEPDRDDTIQSNESMKCYSTSDTTLSNKEIIKGYKERLGIHIPTPRNVSEFELSRVKLHVCWWLVKSKEGKKGADIWYSANPSIDEINKILESATASSVNTFK